MSWAWDRAEPAIPWPSQGRGIEERRGEVLEQRGRLFSMRRGIRNDNAFSQESENRFCESADSHVASTWTRPVARGSFTHSHSSSQYDRKFFRIKLRCASCDHLTQCPPSALGIATGGPGLSPWTAVMTVAVCFLPLSRPAARFLSISGPAWQRSEAGTERTT